MVGAGESGKSTVFKQMKIIQQNGGYSEEELQSYKYIVYGNCITQMKTLIQMVFNLGYQFDDPENAVSNSTPTVNEH
jgi:hypothetical protein